MPMNQEIPVTVNRGSLTSLLANTSSTTCFAYSGSSQIKMLSKTAPAFTYTTLFHCINIMMITSLYCQIDNVLRSYLPNLNPHILNWLKNIKIRVIFKLCIGENEITKLDIYFFFLRSAVIIIYNNIARESLNIY